MSTLSPDRSGSPRWAIGAVMLLVSALIAALFATNAWRFAGQRRRPRRRLLQPPGQRHERPAAELPHGDVQRARLRPHEARRRRPALRGRGDPDGVHRPDPPQARHRRRGLPGVPGAAVQPVQGARRRHLADLPRGGADQGRDAELHRLAHRRLGAHGCSQRPGGLRLRCVDQDAVRPAPRQGIRPARVVRELPQRLQQGHQPAEVPGPGAGDRGRPRQPAVGVRRRRWSSPAT